MALLAKIGYGQVEPNSINAKRTGAILSDVPVSVAAFTALNKKVEQGMFLRLEAGGAGVKTNLKTVQLGLPKAADTLELTVVQVTTMPDGQKAVKLMVTAEGDGLTQLVYNEEKLYHDSQGRKDFVLTTEGGNIFLNRQNVYRNADKEDINTVVPRTFKLIVGDRYTTNLVDVAAPAVGDVLIPGIAGVLVKKA